VPEPSIDSLAREIFSDEIADLFAASSGKDGDDVPLPIPSDNHCDATAAQLVLGKLYAQAANCQSPVAASAPEHELLQSPKSLSLDRNAPLPMSAEPNFPERMAAAAEKAVDQTFARKNHYNPLSHNTAPDQEMALVTQYLELQQGKTTAMDPSAMDLPVRVQRNLKVAIETVEVYLQHESGQHEPMPFIPATRRLIEYEYQYETTRYELQIKLNKACLDRSSSDGSQASQDSMSDDQILNSMVYSLQTHFDALLAQLPPNAATQLISHGSLDEYQVKPSAKTFWPITEAMRQNYGLLYMFWNGETKRFELDIFLAPFESKRGRCTKVVQILHQQAQLHQVIVTVLQQNGWLRYYQGFNDVCTVFLLTLRPEDLQSACENAALLYFRDFMHHDFAPVHTFLECAYTLIEHDDQVLHARITHVALPPYFATSWLLTWFSHSLNDLTAISRLFDFFLSSNPLMPVYFVAALILSVREDLLAMEPEFTLFHGYLRDVPSRLTLDKVNHLISEASRLWQSYDLHRIFPNTFNHQ
ncbi:GTPase-activating protein gyp8, partial [Dimargaris verticillata]